MFLFFNHFDTIAGHPLTLKIIEKNPGDQQAIPFLLLQHPFKRL